MDKNTCTAIIHVPKKPPIIFDDLEICQDQRYVNYQGRTITREEYDKLWELEQIKTPLRVFGKELDMSVRYDIMRRFIIKWGIALAVLLGMLIFLGTELFGREVDWDSYENNHAKYEEAIDSAAAWYNIKPEIIMAVITWESQWKERATNPAKTCFGLMQVKGGHFAPLRNILAGAGKLQSCKRKMVKYCKKHRIKYDDRLILLYALSAYNYGYYGFIEKRMEKGKGPANYAYIVYGISIVIKQRRNK